MGIVSPANSRSPWKAMLEHSHDQVCTGPPPRTSARWTLLPAEEEPVVQPSRLPSADQMRSWTFVPAGTAATVRDVPAPDRTWTALTVAYARVGGGGGAAGFAADLANGLAATTTAAPPPTTVTAAAPATTALPSTVL